MKFKKKSSDIIDFTLLQKRGLIKSEPIKQDSEIVDFTQNSNSQSKAESQAFASSSSSPFDFLDSMAGNSTGASINNSYSSASSSTETKMADSVLNSQINEMKIKLDDYEYKMEALEQRIRELEKRMR